MNLLNIATPTTRHRASIGHFKVRKRTWIGTWKKWREGKNGDWRWHSQSSMVFWKKLKWMQTFWKEYGLTKGYKRSLIFNVQCSIHCLCVGCLSNRLRLHSVIFSFHLWKLLFIFNFSLFKIYERSTSGMQNKTKPGKKKMNANIFQIVIFAISIWYFATMIVLGACITIITNNKFFSSLLTLFLSRS